MAIERVDTGTRMSQVVVSNGLAFFAGQVAVDAPGAPVARQTENVLDRIDQLLDRVGLDRTKILIATIWLADMATFEEMNAVWDDWIPKGHAPARATVEVRCRLCRGGRWSTATPTTQRRLFGLRPDASGGGPTRDPGMS